MESSLPSGYGQILRVFRQGFSPWAERSTDDTCSNWATGRYNSEEMKATDMRTGQAADHRFKSQGLVCSLELPRFQGLWPREPQFRWLLRCTVAVGSGSKTSDQRRQNVRSRS